jgi:Na+/H+ antiporter NhaD/arsenite permease-like protein
MDFLKNTGLIAWIGMVASLFFFYFLFRKGLRAAQKGIPIDPSRYPRPKEAIDDLPHRSSCLLSTAARKESGHLFFCQI